MSDDKKKQGKVFTYTYTKKGELVPANTLLRPIKKQSKQKSEEHTWELEDGLVEPPYPINVLMLLFQNSIYASTVRQIAKDVAGQGWDIVPKEEGKENEAEFQRVKEHIDNISPEVSLRNLFENLIIDWGHIGYFGIEVGRNPKGEPSEIYRCPAHTLRIHKSKNKFCQKRETNKVWFKKYGYEKDIAQSSGKEGRFSYQKRGNELIYYKNFYPYSDFYGVPNIISAVPELLEYQSIKSYNSNFFDNYGVPEAIVKLEGDWEDGTEEKITRFIDEEIRGTENAHRTMVMHPAEGCKFEWIPLQKTEKKESSFLNQQKMDRDNILIAYSMPPERIGIRVVGPLGGNVTEEANKIYFEKVVCPLQNDLAEIINLLISEISDNYKFQFHQADIRNKKELTEQHTEQIEHGIKTPNEARKELGLKGYPEGDKFYIASNLIEVGEKEE